MPIDIERGYGDTAPYGEGEYKGESGITYVPDYLQRARRLMVEQFEDSEKFLQVIDSFSRQIQEIEDVLYDLRMKRYLSIAEGAQLDGIGEIVGETRSGRGDDDYRFAINFKIFQNKSFGEMNILSNILAQSLPGTVFTLEESYPATVNVVIDSTSLDSLPGGIFSQLDKLAAGGVLVNGFMEDLSGNGKIFRTVEGTSDGSGSFSIPPKPDAGTVTEGAIGSFPPAELIAGKLLEQILTGA
jgi:hypothetical protein